MSCFAMPVAAPPMPNVAAAPFFAASEEPAVDQSVGSASPRVAVDAGDKPYERVSFDRGDAGGGPSSIGGRYMEKNGRLAEKVVPDGDRHVAIATHLSPLAFIWIGPFALAIPLVLWLVRKDESQFVNDHGRENINFIISFFLLHIFLAITIVGVVLVPVLWIISVVSLIRGAMAASRHEYYRYPVSIRFL